MAVQLGDHIDLQEKELQNALLHPVTVDPPGPSEAQVWWRSDLNELRIWDGAAVRAFRFTGAITSADIQDGTITNTDISGTAGITYGKLVLTGSISLADMAANSVDASKIVDGSVGANELGNDAVTQAKVADDAIGAAELRDDGATDANRAVTTNHVRDAAITTGKIADDAVDAAKLKDDASVDGNRAVTTNHLRDQSVTSAKIADGTITNTDIAAGAGIVMSKLAVDPTARANHSGTQLANTISDFATVRDQQRLDQHAAPTSAVNFGNQKASGMADGTAVNDGATWGQVQNLINGVHWTKARVATTANITLSGTQTIDGVAVVAGDRVLVKNQSTAAQNGVYVVAAGAWARAADMDAASEIDGRVFVIEDGTTLAGTMWITTSEVTTLGTDAITFSQFNAAADVVDGNGLSKSGLTFSVNVDGTTIEISADALRLKDLGVTTAKLANDAVDATKLRDDPSTDANRAVTRDHIRNGAIDNSKLANNSVGSNQIQDASITDVEIYAGNKDGAAGTPSMRTLGRTAQQALPGTAVPAGALGKWAQFDASGNITAVDAPVIGVGAPVGTIYQWGGTAAPTGYLLCDGSLLDQAAYPDLYAVIGTAFNIGGEAGGTFRVPDFRGRMAIGVGQGSGLTDRARGAKGGEETHVLTTTEMPSHSHGVSDPGHSHYLQLSQGAPSGAGSGNPYGVDNGLANWFPRTEHTGTGISINSAGGGAAHNVMSPYLAVNYIIQSIPGAGGGGGGGTGALKYAQAIGNGIASSFVIPHNLGTTDVQVAVREVAAPSNQIITTIEITDNNSVTVRFSTPPTTNQYRVVVLG